MVLRVGGEVTLGQRLEAELMGPSRMRIEGVVGAVGPVGPDDRRLVVVDLVRIVVWEDRHGADRVLRALLGCDPKTVPAMTHGDGVAFLVDPATAAEWQAAAEAARDAGPRVRVAGERVGESPPPPLETGLPPTTVARLRAFLAEDPRTRVGMYLNVPCAYSVAGSTYWGRALRLNDRFLHVNTASVVPGLGVRIRCDLTLEIEGVRRAVSLYGTLTQKKDPPAGTMYKATLEVRLARIDERESPGLLLYYLRRQRDAEHAA